MLKRFFEEIAELGFRERLLLLLIFVLPFERIPTVEVGGITVKLSLLAGSLLIVLSLRRILNILQSLWRKKSFLLAPLLLLIYSLLSLIWAEDLGFWVKSNLSLGFCILIFYAVIAVIQKGSFSKLITCPEPAEGMTDSRLVKLSVGALFASTLLILSFGFFQWFGDLINLSPLLTQIRPEYAADRLGLPRIHSTFLEPLYFGLFLLLPLSLSLADRKNQFFKSLYRRLGFIALIYAGILLSLARGAIAASAVLGVTSIFYNFGELKKQLKFSSIVRIGLFGVLSLVILVGAVSVLGKKGTDEDHNYARGFGTIVGHLETIKPWGNKEDELEQNSISSRDEARSEAWRVINKDYKNLSLGVGAGQYGVNLEPKQDFGATSNFVFLDVWAEYGVFAAAALLFFILLLVYSGFKFSGNEKNLALGLSLFVVGFLVQGISFGEIGITSFWVALGILAATATHCIHNNPIKVHTSFPA
jgi:hypothetical protein